MKIKGGFIGALFIGLIAGGVRFAQYCTVIDQDGYYTHTTLAVVLNGILAGVLLLGLLFTMICGIVKNSAPVTAVHLGRQRGTLRILFSLLGILSAADALRRLLDFSAPMTMLGGVFCLFGAAGWLYLGLRRAESPAGPAALLPLLQMMAMILSYFWETYKFIHVSEYSLTLLSLCAAALFTLALMRLATGSALSQHRLARSAGLLLLMAPTGFWAVSVGVVQALLWKSSTVSTLAERLIMAGFGVLFWLIAVLTLNGLPVLTSEELPETGPDISQLNDYIGNLPNEEEQNHD